MAQNKDEYLNQSYYGPTIPPQQTTTNHFRHNVITSPIKDCTPYSLLCAVFKIITLIIIAVGIVALIVWLVYQPSTLKVYVESANLTRYDLSINNTLDFSLNAELSFRNPNKRVGLYYKKIEAMAFYDDAKLGDVFVPNFHQPKKNTTVLGLSFVGPALAVGETGRLRYSREKSEGWFYVDVKVYTKVRLRMIVVNSVEYTPEIDCSLRLPAPTNASSVAAGFVKTECHVDHFS